MALPTFFDNCKILNLSVVFNTLVKAKTENLENN